VPPSRTKGTQSLGTPAAGQPAMFDTLIQSSAVGLFHAYGMAAAPLTPVEVPFAEFRPHYPLAVIGFRTRGMDAALIISIPPEVCAELRLGDARQHNVREVARELANQTMGRIKNRLSQYQVTLTCGLPVCVDRERDLELIAPQRGPLLVYGLRTVHQHIVIAIKGHVDPSVLVYSSTTRINREGAILVFDETPHRGEGAKS